MPIYEFYCQKNHTIYQFYAKSLAQASIVPPCPDNPDYPMKRIMSAFSVNSGAAQPPEPSESTGAPSEAAMAQMEREFAGIDENDPRAIGRAMRRMAELSGEGLDERMEETVRKLEEGADPDSLEGELGDELPAAEPGTPRSRARRSRPAPPPARRDPALYDYPPS